MGACVRRSLARWLCSAALVLLLCPAVSGAATERVALGGTKFSSKQVDLRETFRGSVERELDALNRQVARAGARYVLTASAEVKHERRAGRWACAVSMTLATEQGGALHAVISGRASLTAGSADREAAELILDAALRRAFARVPQALR